MSTENQIAKMFKGNDIDVEFEIIDRGGIKPDLRLADEILLSVSDTASSETNHFTIEKSAMTIYGESFNFASAPIAATDVVDMLAGVYYLELLRSIGGKRITSATGSFILADSNND